MSFNNRLSLFRLLHFTEDPATGKMLYRVLIHGNLVQYVVVDAGIIADEYMHSEAALVDLLPLPSTNDWKCLRVYQCAGNGELGK